MFGATATVRVPTIPPASPISIHGRRMPSRDVVRSLSRPKKRVAHDGQQRPDPGHERQVPRGVVDADQVVDLQRQRHQQRRQEEQRATGVRQRVERDEGSAHAHRARVEWADDGLGVRRWCGSLASASTRGGDLSRAGRLGGPRPRQAGVSGGPTREDADADPVQPRHQPVDHDRDGDVARTKVRSTGPASASQAPSARLRTVRVGKTATQIIRASWCLVGGADDWLDCVGRVPGAWTWRGSSVRSGGDGVGTAMRRPRRRGRC